MSIKKQVKYPKIERRNNFFKKYLWRSSINNILSQILYPHHRMVKRSLLQLLLLDQILWKDFYRRNTPGLVCMSKLKSFNHFMIATRMYQLVEGCP